MRATMQINWPIIESGIVLNIILGLFGIGKKWYLRNRVRKRTDNRA
jgi:hypothetical protein